MEKRRTIATRAGEWRNETCERDMLAWIFPTAGRDTDGTRLVKNKQDFWLALFEKKERREFKYRKYKNKREAKGKWTRAMPFLCNNVKVGRASRKLFSIHGLCLRDQSLSLSSRAEAAISSNKRTRELDSAVVLRTSLKEKKKELLSFPYIDDDVKRTGSCVSSS